jgi:hypothetical protein
MKNGGSEAHLEDLFIAPEVFYFLFHETFQGQSTTGTCDEQNTILRRGVLFPFLIH